jgi:hypothetical protein
MKFIKLFENHKLYYEIDRTEFATKVFVDDKLQFLDQINNVEYKFLDTNLKLNRTYYPLDSINKKMSNTCLEIDCNKNIYLLHKLKDEWWYINEKIHYSNSDTNQLKFKFYKCDQWDGLLSFLKDKELL